MAANKQIPRTIRVFIASPGDLAVERAAFKEVIDDLNTGFGDGAGIKFEALGWEDTLASTGRRSQGVINLDVDRADVFVLAMNRRWGQDAPDAKPYSSYTEEEFHRAYNRWKKKPGRGKERSPEIFVFFKHIDPASMADAGPQLQKVLDFRKQLEESREVLYRGFKDEAEFKKEIDNHLRAFAKDELPKADAKRKGVLLPRAAIEEIKKEKAEKEQALAMAEKEHQVAEAERARADAFALDFAERAAKVALDGRLEEARQNFAKATNGTTNLRVLYLAYDFYERTGDLATAEDMLERWLAITGRDAETLETEAALGNLGLINLTRGELDRAEEMFLKAIAIDKKLGRKEGLAKGYNNLGVIYKSRGELERAEEIYLRSKSIHQELGNQLGVASTYSNLGVIYHVRGEVERAEEMHLKSLAIDEKLGHQEGMATDYNNLGLVYKGRGELDRAEAMYRKTIDISEKLGRQEGVAAACTNLGLIYGRRGDLEQSEKMHLKSLNIAEKVGHQEGMAIACANLGLNAIRREDLDRAHEFLTKGRDLYARMGLHDEARRLQELLTDHS